MSPLAAPHEVREHPVPCPYHPPRQRVMAWHLSGLCAFHLEPSGEDSPPEGLTLWGHPCFTGVMEESTTPEESNMTPTTFHTEDGQELGFTFHNGRDFTLTDAGGHTLVRTARTLDEARQALTEHAAWVATRFETEEV